MHLKQICRLFAIAVVLGANSVSAAKPVTVTPNVVDESGDVSQDAGWLAHLQKTLDEFARDDGIKVLIQFHAKSPPDKEDQHPGDYMRALSTQLGVIQKGILMVHFADDPDWRVWIGDDLTPKFVGKPGNAKDFTESGAMHEAKEAVLTAAMGHAADKYGTLNLPTVDLKTPASGVLLRLEADAIIDRLKVKFAPEK